ISRMQEAIPVGWEFVLETEQTRPRRLLIIRKQSFQRLLRRTPQHISTLARRVLEMQHDITECVEIERVILLWQVNTPAPDRARAFEREIAFVAEIQFKQAAVV